MARKDPLKIKDLEPNMKVSGHIKECEQCSEWFIARIDARFCSNACRVAFSRAKPPD